MQLVWWHWVLAGMAALLVDLLLINIYYMLWIGLAGIAVGGMMILLPEMTLISQIASFGVLSAIFLTFWIYVLRGILAKVGFDKDDLIGVRGVVTNWNKGSGKIRLQRPFSGTDVWKATGPAQLRVGDIAVIEDMKNRTAILRSVKEN